ncbi:hypothetical protein PCANC_21624 [Puccinia coronata f. sp. avenae]|uniref:Uncharacterized protein n=1 Tax=Puccinia coronata f. sp. avenae TaxID=200324 RepID=A0A2N5S897_9BASI|nr:hypothetical protein PCANC_21500 [Puccinia coronata f. sp. avenae]PLW28780.1 hypothetical protein PCANC_21624 [Puccinia coronata f. sp. avenae]
MSNTAAEAVPAPQPAQPVAEAPATTPEAPAAQPNKRFSNVQKTVGSKAKAFLDMFHTAGEQIRGNINAALDGAGDAIAGRKTGTVAGRKSGEQATRSVPPAPAAAPAAAADPAPAAPAAAATSAAPETNPTAESPPAADQHPEEKRFVVGEFVNNSFKRTATLVHRVGGSLRSKGTSTVGSLGNSISAGKQRASRRFSRGPKAATEGQATPVASVAEAPAEAAPAVAPAPAAEPATTTA